MKTAIRLHFTKLLLMATLSILALTGCVSANHGRLQGNRDVTESFKSGQALDDHRYYFFGSQNRPSALIGIYTGYTLDTRRWVEFDAQGDGLQRRVRQMIVGGRNPSYRGFDIVGPEGDLIGVWFSNAGFIRDASVRLGEDNMVTISPPTLSEQRTRRVSSP